MAISGEMDPERRMADKYETTPWDKWREVSQETLVTREQLELEQQERWGTMEVAPLPTYVPPYKDPVIGIGGAPTRNTTLPTTAKERKQYPIATGFLDYFPDAIAAIAHLSWKGNDQHNPGQPVHWAREKSADEADTAMRHFLQRGTLDDDGIRHSVKAAWRMLALLQKEIEAEQQDAAA